MGYVNHLSYRIRAQQLRLPAQSDTSLVGYAITGDTVSVWGRCKSHAELRSHTSSEITTIVKGREERAGPFAHQAG